MASSRLPGCGLLIRRLAGMPSSRAPIGTLVPGTRGPIRQVPSSIPRPEYVGKARATPFTGSEVKNAQTIGRVIESYAKRFGYGVVRDYTGHGVGEAFHSGLVIPHYDAAPDYDTVIRT